MTCRWEKAVSVIVPVYNAERYLSRCFDSILAQSYKQIEVVAIDDGSQDKSAAILDAYAEKYGNIFQVVHQSNAGAANARNRAISLAHGEYLTFVDNDDWLDSDYLETLVNALESSDSDLVCSGYRRPNSNGKVMQQVIPQPNDEWGKYIVAAAWAKLYRTEFVRRGCYTFLDTNIDEDLYFTLPAIEESKSVLVVPYCGYNWFNNSESVSNTSQKSSSKLCFEETMNAILRDLRDREIPISDEITHYIVRLVAWFLLYTCKADGSELSNMNLAHFTAWLDGKVPAWRSDPLARLGHPTGDAAINQAAVWLFAKHPTVFAIALRAYRMVS